MVGSQHSTFMISLHVSFWNVSFEMFFHYKKEHHFSNLLICFVTFVFPESKDLWHYFWKILRYYFFKYFLFFLSVLSPVNFLLGLY